MKKKVIVIGAGIAGMTAALELVENGFAVEIFESKKYAGGRCFSIIDAKTGDCIDNGQHVFVSAYTNFFELLRRLGTFDNVFPQVKMHLPIYDQGKRGDITKGFLPGKAGLLQALLNYSLIDYKSKMAIISLILKMNKIDDIKYDYVVELFRDEKQTERAVKYFWEPLILATMNQSVQNSSSGLFLNVIRKMLSDADNGKIYFSKVGLSELFKPFETKICKYEGSKVHFSKTVKAIQKIDNGRFRAIDSSGEVSEADYLISAIPPKSLSILLKNSNISSNINTNFNHSTIVSCYIWTDKEFGNEIMTGFVNSVSDWMFDRRRIEKKYNEEFPYQYTVTISNADKIADELHSEIVSKIVNDIENSGLSQDFAIKHWRLLIDKRATVSITGESNKYRPDIETDIENFYISGDWTKTNLPATIEGAAQSGKAAAKKIIFKKNIFVE